MRRLLVVLALLSAERLLPAPARTAEGEYDLIVYGGTSAGVSAAIQAARMGRRVILVEPGERLETRLAGQGRSFLEVLRDAQ